MRVSRERLHPPQRVGVLSTLRPVSGQDYYGLAGKITRLLSAFPWGPFECPREREGARKAAKLAASEQAISGDTAAISFEVKGRWHNEIADALQARTARRA